MIGDRGNTLQVFIFTQKKKKYPLLFPHSPPLYVAKARPIFQIYFPPIKVEQATHRLQTPESFKPISSLKNFLKKNVCFYEEMGGG